jgi:CDGSH-type Zn-finger protein/uncharacterized Fe-S cluster protein YjdI
MSAVNGVNEPDASQGGTGAPPPENAPNRVRPGLTREYVRPEIRVQWFASRCIHSARCIQALPSVFDPRRRPWVDVAQGDADAIAHAVMQCPTGALQFERTDGGPQEPVPDTVAVIPYRNGPYLVRGAIDIVDPATGEARRETRVALCRCGQSKHMPFCDNTHRAIGFRSNEGTG